MTDPMAMRPFRSFVRAALAAVALVAGFIACHGPTEALPLGATSLEPLAPYRTWWQLVEACSGLTGSFDAVNWYVAAVMNPNDLSVDAVWIPARNEIVLRDPTNGGLVRHEMLHALLQRGGHPAEYFGDKCASLVKCELNCAPPEHDRGVPATAHVIRLTELEVSVRIAPEQPSVSIDSGWVRVILDATNPYAESVWVVLPQNDTYSCYSSAGELGWTTPPEYVWAFRASERRSYTFDFQFATGAYTIFCNFSLYAAAPYTLSVNP